MATTTYSSLKKAKELHRDDVWAIDQPGVKNPVTERMGVSRGATLDKLVKFIAEQEEIGGYINETILEEQERAEAEEKNIRQALTEETARAQTVEQQLSSDIVDEQTRAQQAEGALGLHIDSEEARAVSAEQNIRQQSAQEIAQSASALEAALAAEAERARQAESELQEAITGEQIRAQAAETNLDAQIHAEEARTNAVVAGAIQAEAARADAAVAAAVAGFHEDVSDVRTALNEEAVRAENAEADIQAAVSNEASRAQGVENTLQTALTGETARAQEAEQDNAAASAAEKTRAQAEEQLINTALAAETTRAKAAEQTNTISIDAEEVRAKEAEERLDEAVDAEENRAKAVEQSLSLAMVRKSSFESGEAIEDIWVFDSVLDRTVLKKRLVKADGSGYRDVSVNLPLADAARAGSMSIEDKQAVELHKSLLLGAAENIQEQIDKLNQLGHYYGAFDTYNQADETRTSLATDGGSPTPNDFAHIRADETHDGAKTRYVYKDLGDGTYVWVFDVLIDQDDRNFETSPLQETELADGAVSDGKIGERTISSEAIDAPVETGTFTELLSNLSGRIEDKHERLNRVESTGNIELAPEKQVRIKDREGTPHIIAQVHSETVQAPSDIPISDTAVLETAALSTEEIGIADILPALAGKENVSAVSIHGVTTAENTTRIQLVESNTDSVLYDQDGSGSFDLDLSAFLASPAVNISARVTNTGAAADTVRFTGMYVSVTADTLAATAEIGNAAQHTDIQSTDRPTVNGTDVIAYQADIAAEAQRAQTAEQANAQAAAEKLARRIDYGNGIVEEYFLDATGGGHKMEDAGDNSVSFSGFNHDADNPVNHETSVKNKSNGIGTRLVQTLAKLFYTKNRADDSFTGGDEIQVKSDVDAAVQAAKTYADQALAAAAQATTYAGTAAAESGLPAAGSIHGQYYEIDDMDITAPGKSGRAVWNGVSDPARWDKRVDQQREADGETIGFRASDGALEILDVAMSGVTADITDYESTVSGGFHAVLLGIFKKIRGLFNLTAGKVNIQQNAADAGKALVIGSDGNVIAGNPDAFIKLANTGVGTDVKMNIDAIANGSEVLFDLWYNETSNGAMVVEAAIHGQFYTNADGNDARHGMVQNTNKIVRMSFYKDSNGVYHLWIPKIGSANFPSIRAVICFRQTTGIFIPILVNITSPTDTPPDTMMEIQIESNAHPYRMVLSEDKAGTIAANTSMWLYPTADSIEGGLKINPNKTGIYVKKGDVILATFPACSWTTPCDMLYGIFAYKPDASTRVQYVNAAEKNTTLLENKTLMMVIQEDGLVYFRLYNQSTAISDLIFAKAEKSGWLYVTKL